MGELQTQQEPSKAKMREANLLRRETQKLEAQIMALNAENLKLADTHRHDRNTFVESQNKLRILGKRERELAKHVHAIAAKLSESSLALSHEGKDFRNLPGMCIGKIAGKAQKAPPLVPGGTLSRLPSGVNTPQDEPQA